MKQVLFILCVFMIYGCNDKVKNIYESYPKGIQLSKEDLKYMQAIYFIDSENIAMKIDLGQVKNIDSYMPHILFFNKTLTLTEASYFPFLVDSIENYTIYCQYTDKDCSKRTKEFQNDIPSYIKVYSSYQDHPIGNHKSGLLLKNIILDEFPILSLIVYDEEKENLDTLRASCNGFEFRLWNMKSPEGIIGYIQIQHKEKMFPPEYQNNIYTGINIDDVELINEFYDKLWLKLQEIFSPEYEFNLETT